MSLYLTVVDKEFSLPRFDEISVSKDENGHLKSFENRWKQAIKLTTNKQAFLGINNKKINAELNLLKKKACLSQFFHNKLWNVRTGSKNILARSERLVWLLVQVSQRKIDFHPLRRLYLTWKMMVNCLKIHKKYSNWIKSKRKWKRIAHCFFFVDVFKGARDNATFV